MLLSACVDSSVVLTREDGARWDGHLAVGERVTIGPEVVSENLGGYTADEPAPEDVSVCVEAARSTAR